jgi:hypothetical protein
MITSAADRAVGSSVIARCGGPERPGVDLARRIGSGPVGGHLGGGLLVADRGPHPAEGQGEREPDIAQTDDCHALRHAGSPAGSKAPVTAAPAMRV